MDKKIRSILIKHLCAMIDIIGSHAVLLVTFGAGIALQLMLARYLFGINGFMFWVIDIAGLLAIALSPLKILFQDALILYRDIRILWIEVQRDIQKAQEKSDDEK